MTTQICSTCRKPKAAYACDLCQEPSCKSCTHFLNDDSFSFLKVIPEELKKTNYCLSCFNSKVSGPLETYNQTMEAAKNIIIYTNKQGKLTRYLKRKSEPYHVENCLDEEDVMMRMAFYAVQDNFNTLIDVNITSKTIKDGSHKHQVWAGTGVPITIDPESIRGH